MARIWCASLFFSSVGRNACEEGMFLKLAVSVTYILYKIILPSAKDDGVLGILILPIAWSC